MPVSHGGPLNVLRIKCGTSYSPDRNLSDEEKFQVLRHTYLALNHTKTCSMPDALAQTCWLQKEDNGTLHVDESD